MGMCDLCHARGVCAQLELLQCMSLIVSANADFGSALDKIADDKPTGTGAGTAAEAGAGTGMLAAAADYLHSGARSVADTAHQYTGADDVNTNKVFPSSPGSCQDSKAA